jgi:hypothetical protein
MHFEFSETSEARQDKPASTLSIDHQSLKSATASSDTSDKILKTLPALAICGKAGIDLTRLISSGGGDLLAYPKLIIEGSACYEAVKATGWFGSKDKPADKHK